MNNDIIKQIGKTPLIEIKKLHRNSNVKIFAKAEYYNLSGSIKDRPALYMIKEGIKSGKLTKDKIILESTSGNTGIGLALLARLRGYRIRLVIPASASIERKKILSELRAELVLTDPSEGSDGAYKEAGRIYAEGPSKYFRPDQYSNPNNPKSHYEGTAQEIWKQANGKITHFVASIGTSGTLTGNGKKLKELDKDIKVIGVEPEEELHGIEGLKNLRVEKVPSIYDSRIIDHSVYITTEEAYATAVALAREERLFAGQSSGLNIAAALRIADTLKEGIIVTVLPDSGYKYLSRGMFPNDIFDILIKKQDMEKIHEQARKQFPLESCGLLVGKITQDKKIITGIVPSLNMRKDRGKDRYEINPKEYLRVENELKRNESIIGVFHSHPNNPARPSSTDLKKAQPTFSYIIVSVIAGAVLSTTAWTLADDEESFREEFILTK